MRSALVKDTEIPSTYILALECFCYTILQRSSITQVIIALQKILFALIAKKTAFSGKINDPVVCRKKLCLQPGGLYRPLLTHQT